MVDARGEVIEAIGEPASADLPALLEQAAAGRRPTRAAAWSVPSTGLGAGAASSHSGEPRHVAARAQAMLTQAALARMISNARRLAAGRRSHATSLDRERRWSYPACGMNCSGKHAAMMLTCQANGWDPSTDTGR